MLVIVYKSPNMIERDAIIAFLSESGISSFTGQRDVIVNLANEPNLSLEGYSAMFNGYDIYVESELKDLAYEKIKFFLQSSNKPKLELADHLTNPQDQKDLAQSQSEKKILSQLLFGIFFPLFNLPFVGISMIRFYKANLIIRPRFIFQFFILCFLNLVFVLILIAYLQRTFFAN